MALPGLASLALGGNPVVSLASFDDFASAHLPQLLSDD